MDKKCQKCTDKYDKIISYDIGVCSVCGESGAVVEVERRYEGKRDLPEGFEKIFGKIIKS